MPRFVDVTDTGVARTVLGTGRVYAVSNFIASTASYQAAIVAAAAAAGSGGTVDFEGVSYVTTGTVTIATNGVTLANGGIRPTGQFTALTVNADDVTVRDMTFSRSQSGGYTDGFTARCCVIVNGERFTSSDCDYLASAAACVYLTHGACDGAVIRGGRMTGTATYQNACGVYAEAGVTGNQNLTVDGVHMYDMNYGVLLFDTGSSLVTNCRVESMRMIPTVTVTGWTLVSGNIYRQRTAAGTTPGTDGPSTDRDQGNTNTVYNNGVHMGEVIQGSTTPTSNQASVSGGYLYINLGGTDPASRTITSGIVSGYAFMCYINSADPSVVSGNRFVNNYAEDIDGMGIYFQLSNAGGAHGNHAIGNYFKDVCLEGAQHPSLPFAGIGVIGGSDTLLALNTIDVCGSSGKTAPGVYILPGTTNTSPGGRVIGMTVRNGLSVGYMLRSAGWTFSGCRAESNANHGFYVYTTATSGVIDGVTISGCVSKSNTGVGFYVDGSTTTITNISVNIIGGAAISNTSRGVQISGSASTTTVTRCSVIGVLSKENGTSSQQIILSGAAVGITVAGCNMVHSGTSTGLYVAATVTGVQAYGNNYSISTPETFLAAVDIGGTADTTLQRSSAGVLAVEGVVIPSISSTSTLTNKTLTSPKITSGSAPASAGATGTVGQIQWDADYIYVCTATNTWKRVGIATWP